MAEFDMDMVYWVCIIGENSKSFLQKKMNTPSVVKLCRKNIYIFELLIWFVELPSKLFFHVVFFQIFVPYFPMQK